MIVKIYTYDQFTPLFGNICESESTPKHIYAWERLNKIVAAPATLLIWCCDDHYRGSINLWGLFSQRPNQLLRNIFSKLATFGVKYWKHLIENIWLTKRRCAAIRRTAPLLSSSLLSKILFRMRAADSEHHRGEGRRYNYAHLSFSMLASDASTWPLCI